MNLNRSNNDGNLSTGPSGHLDIVMTEQVILSFRTVPSAPTSPASCAFEPTFSSAGRRTIGLGPVKEKTVERVDEGDGALLFNAQKPSSFS